ncbi:Malate dehydrogenase [Gammaproteobacteria bacterium]
MRTRKKVTIVGGGQTGGMMAYHLAAKNICDIVIKDVPEFAQHYGKALDITQCASFAGFETEITATVEWAPTANSDVIVITSGAPRTPGMSREDLLRGNAKIVGDIARNAAQQSPNAVIIVFSNPMDVMCHVALRESGFPRERILGQGGMLDSERFRTFIALELGVSQRDVHAYVLGGHTDTTMVPIVSHACAGGIPISSLISNERLAAIVARTMKGGAEIVQLYKAGSAFFAPAVATITMVESILLDEKRIIPCAILFRGEYGVSDVFCGTVVKLGAGGAEQIYEVPVDPNELERIRAAAKATSDLFSSLNDVAA